MRKKTNKPKIKKQDLEAWFLGLNQAQYLDLCSAWNMNNFKFKLPKLDNYDEWFNFFKKLPANQVRHLQTTGEYILSVEAFAALRMWSSIVTSPEKITKIHQSALIKDKKKKEKSTLELARDNDVLGVLKRIRDDLVVKQENANIKDLPNVSRAITEVMDQISEIERRQAPSANTYLGQLLEDTSKIRVSKKRNTQSGNGARITSFKSRVTIKDLEGENEKS